MAGGGGACTVARVPLPSSLLAWFCDPADATAQFGVLAGGGHAAEAADAFAVLAELLRALGVVDGGRLGLVDSRNHARRVEHPRFGACVLKLTVVAVGDEVGALAAWNDAGLGGRVVPALHDHGTCAGWAWSVQQRCPGRAGWVNEPLLATGDALAVCDVLHVPLPAGHGFGDVRDRLDRRLGALAGTELAGPARVVRDAVAGLEAGSVLVHGDFAANNVLAGAGSPVVIDPAGLAGPAEYDAARWIARSDSRVRVSGRFASLVPGWADPGVLAVLTAAELLDMANWQRARDVTGRAPAEVAADALALLS